MMSKKLGIAAISSLLLVACGSSKDAEPEPGKSAGGKADEFGDTDTDTDGGYTSHASYSTDDSYTSGSDTDWETTGGETDGTTTGGDTDWTTGDHTTSPSSTTYTTTSPSTSGNDGGQTDEGGEWTGSTGW